jgi:hypothetical protein
VLGTIHEIAAVVVTAFFAVGFVALIFWAVRP